MQDDVHPHPETGTCGLAGRLRHRKLGPGHQPMALGEYACGGMTHGDVFLLSCGESRARHLRDRLRCTLYAAGASTNPRS
jgi:hypothetical protein